MMDPQEMAEERMAELGAAEHDGEEKERRRIKEVIRARIDDIEKDAPVSGIGFTVALNTITLLKAIVADLDPKPDTDAF